LKTMTSIETKIFNRIKRKERGWCFFASQFLDLGSREAVDTALSRLTAEGKITRIDRGLYYRPRIHSIIGMVAPDPDEVLRALVESKKIKILPDGPLAANLLGLSEQVPAKMEYVSDGLSKVIKVGSQKIFLKQMSRKIRPLGGTTSGIVVQALKYLYNQGIEDWQIEKLRCNLTQKDKKHLLENQSSIPIKLHSFVRQIAGENCFV